MKQILKSLLLLLFPFSALTSFGQSPLVKMWDRNFGGMGDDAPTCFQLTSDGGYILGGYSYSDIGGDKTEPLKNPAGIADYWIIKIDSAGNKEWEKDLGGANGDLLNTVLQTKDGGYLLGGMSASIVSGDKSTPSWGNFDYWIVKLDAIGNVQWDKDFGGSASDQLISAKQTEDGGFILAGNSASGISGNKSQAVWGATDYWVVKTDSLGNMQWDKDFGGSDADKLNTIEQTADGGYLLGGSSWSMVSGDKTELWWGSDDYWIVKIDASGNKEWDRSFGGDESDILYSIHQTSDGGYVLGGRSGSDISGNKTVPSLGGYDFWIIKIDSSGNKKSEKCFGGTGNEDEFGYVFPTDDNGFLVSGTSYSQISGDKSENNLGQEQSWFLKLDSSFNKEWDKTVLTPCHDEIGMAIQTGDQCYTLVNANGPGCGAGGYRSQASWNNTRDYWIIKFCDSTYFPPVAAASGAQNLCPGTCTSFLNLSSNATSYQWSFPGANPDTSSSPDPTGICYGSPGSYDVMLVASNAHKVDTLLMQNFILVNPYPAPQGITQAGDTLYSNQGAAGYQWYFNGSAVAGATEYFYVAIHDGDYNVIVTDVNGCEAEAAIYGIVTSVSAVSFMDGLEIFPNPADDILKINYEKTNLEAIAVYNLPGELVVDSRIQNSAGHETTVDVHTLSKGIYYLELKSGDQTFRTRFVKD
jgi:hypothetical protein